MIHGTLHRRTYFYDDNIVEFPDVAYITVDNEGNHLFESEGHNYIVAPGWRYIELVEITGQA